MDGLKRFDGCKVFLRLKNSRQYTGKVVSVDDLFLTIIDKFNNNVSFAHSEIAEIKEEI